MGGHNRTCLSRRWADMDGDEGLAGTVRPYDGEGSPGILMRGAAESCGPGPADLTPRRGLVYDAVRFHFFPWTQRRRHVRGR
jgi:hypothetical protein